jgi:G3E family GTPase
MNNGCICCTVRGDLIPILVVDAKHLLGEIDRAPEAQEQLGFTEIVPLNKTDLVAEDDLASVEARI